MLAMVDDCKAIGDQQRAREEEEKRMYVKYRITYITKGPFQISTTY